jgi:hypothetical protein
MLRKLMIVFTAAVAIGIATFPTNASAQAVRSSAAH